MNNDCIGALITVTSPFPLKWSNLTSPSHQYQTLYSFPFHQALPFRGWVTPFSGELYKRNRTFSAIYGIAMSSHRTTEATVGQTYIQIFAVFVSYLCTAVQCRINWYRKAVCSKYTSTFFFSRQSVITRCGYERMTAHPCQAPVVFCHTVKTAI